MPGIDIDAGARSARRPSPSRQSLAEAFSCSRLLPANATTYTVINLLGAPWGADGKRAHQGRCGSRAAAATGRLRPLGWAGGEKGMQRAQPAAPLCPGGGWGQSKEPKAQRRLVALPHGGVKAAGSPARGGGNPAVGRVDRSADCCADSVPWGVPPLGRRRRGLQ